MSSTLTRRPWGSKPRHEECVAPEHAQGTSNGYSNFACRCLRCREA